MADKVYCISSLNFRNSILQNWFTMLKTSTEKDQFATMKKYSLQFFQKKNISINTTDAFT